MVGPYTPIPEIGDDEASLREVVIALKATVQIMVGAKNENGAPNQNFVQRNTPTANKVGDQWTRPAVLVGETTVLSTWDGKRWLKII